MAVTEPSSLPMVSLLRDLMMMITLSHGESRLLLVSGVNSHVVKNNSLRFSTV